jgi:hypothetical protein
MMRDKIKKNKDKKIKIKSDKKINDRTPSYFNKN